MWDKNFIATFILMALVLQSVAICFGIFIGWCVWG